VRLGFDRPFLAEIILRGMTSETLNLLVYGSIYGSPYRLRDRSIFLHDSFELADDLGAGLHIQGALRLGQKLIELFVGIGGLVLRDSRAVGQSQYHDA
jgi:hypothetical protein